MTLEQEALLVNTRNIIQVIEICLSGIELHS